MIRTVTRTRHAAAGAAVVLMSGLAGFGVIGAGDHALLRAEHFDAKQVTVRPEGADGVRIREVVDIDFGVSERRGYQREIPWDFGVPEDIVASSPDANASLDVASFGNDTRIRIGDPDVFFTGQHRYVLEYTLPEARVSQGVLALDIIGTDETFTTDRFEVVLTGFALTDTRCDTGSFGQFGGCELVEQASGDHVAVIEPLEPAEGITVGGVIGAERSDVLGSLGELPSLPDRNPAGLRPLAAPAALLGTLATAGVFVASRRFGSNDVHGAGSATDAAYGDLPLPQRGDPIADVPTYRVPDSRLASLATIEFVPPRGIEPWQGAALLSEQVDDDTVAAWFSEMIAREALLVDDDEKLRRGTGDARLSAVDRQHIDRLFAHDDVIELGSYDPAFTATWSAIHREQERFVAESGWWVRGAPGAGLELGGVRRVLMPLAFILVISGGALAAAGRSFATAVSGSVAALLLVVLASTTVAFLAYRSLLPSRSATGSALTLRSESFRRFLTASEGRHVEWAWDNGLLREYSAWAVALGAADAWSKAIEASNIPQPEASLGGPLLLHSAASSFRSSRTAPSSSGSGGSGGFGGGGGGVGGGGGGGSSGSW